MEENEQTRVPSMDGCSNDANHPEADCSRARSSPAERCPAAASVGPASEAAEQQLAALEARVAGKRARLARLRRAELRQATQRWLVGCRLALRRYHDAARRHAPDAPPDFAAFLRQLGVAPARLGYCQRTDAWLPN